MRTAPRPEKIIVVSPSWLGDSLMAMPALCALRHKAPGVRVAVMAKPAVAPLWGLCPAVEEVIEFRSGWRGMRKAVREVASGHFDFAYIIPHSFRSAWIPFLARIPGRRGFPGHTRRWMLTEIVRLRPGGKLHQAEEAFRLFGVESGETQKGPLLAAPEVERTAMVARLGIPAGADMAPLVTMFPGSARGPAKCWPAERFAEVGRRLADGHGCRVVLAGAAGDRAICDGIAQCIGGGAVSLAGRTTLRELAALLSLCRVAIANDSGGMHLAAAMGARVVGIYGITDPLVTGPMGEGHIVLMAPDVARARDISRDSAAGRAALEAIKPDAVYEAAVRLLAP